MLTQKEINSKISGIKRSSNSLRDNIQTVLINIAGHVLDNGDVTALDKLHDATNGVNRKEIAKFADEFCFARLTKSGYKVNKKARKESGFANGEECVNYLTGCARNWWENEDGASQIARQLDAAKRIESLAASIETAIDNHTMSEVDDAALAAALQHLMKAFDKAGVEVAIH